MRVLADLNLEGFGGVRAADMSIWEMASPLKQARSLDLKYKRVIGSPPWTMTGKNRGGRVPEMDNLGHRLSEICGISMKNFVDNREEMVALEAKFSKMVAQEMMRSIRCVLVGRLRSSTGSLEFFHRFHKKRYER